MGLMRQQQGMASARLKLKTLNDNPYSKKSVYLPLPSKGGVHISESVFVGPFTEMWKFQRQKDYGYTCRLCIGYVVGSGSWGRTPYQAECGVLSVVCLCQGLPQPL